MLNYGLQGDSLQTLMHTCFVLLRERICVCVISVGVAAGGKYNVSQHAKNSTSSWSWSSGEAYQKANVSFCVFFFSFRDVLQFGEATQIERNVDTIFQCGFLFSFCAKCSTPEITIQPLLND